MESNWVELRRNESNWVKLSQNSFLLARKSTEHELKLTDFLFKRTSWNIPTRAHVLGSYCSDECFMRHPAEYFANRFKYASAFSESSRDTLDERDVKSYKTFFSFFFFKKILYFYDIPRNWFFFFVFLQFFLQNLWYRPNDQNDC